MKKFFSILLIIGMLFSAAPAFAAAPDVDATDIIIDTIFLRPLGLVSTAFGTTFFLVTLPGTGILDIAKAINGDYTTFKTSSIGTALDLLVKGPAAYTFVRPIGQIKKSD